MSARVMTIMWNVKMSFADRLITFRKSLNLSQAQMADASGVSLQQLKRYETGKNEPSAEAIRKIARTFNISSDRLLFDEDERGPDDDLRYEFEAISDFDPESKETVRQLIVAFIHQQRSRQLLLERGKKSA